MKKRFYLISFFFLLIVTVQLTFAQTTNVTMNFTEDPEWTGSGNTGNVAPNYTDFGYRNIEGVTGVNDGDYGCIGGIFNRTVAYNYYADTELNGNVTRTMTLKVAGSMKLENRTLGSFDGAFCIGYFDASNPTMDNFMGVMIKEPSASPEAAFRGVVCVNPLSNFAISTDIELPQLTKIDFDLTYTGSADGSGTITGKLAGQDINVTVPAGSGEYNSFGLLNGGMANERAGRTRNCYFDDLTYSKVGTSAVDTNTAGLIQVYPNITSGMLYLNNLPVNSRIEIRDMVGRKVADKNASEVTSGLTLQPYTGGMYLIQVIEGNNIVKSVKVLKK